MSPGVKLCSAGVVLLLCCVLSLAVGATWIPLPQIAAAFVDPDPLSISHVLVTTTRLSRTLMAISVGASLAVAGALMQALTRNPLASPGLFGINAGATFLSSCFPRSSRCHPRMPGYGRRSLALLWRVAWCG